MIRSKETRDRGDVKIWDEIRAVWMEYPGLGYRKLSKYLRRNKKQIQRVLQKIRGKREKTKSSEAPRRFNILKEIVRVLEESPRKLLRGNWILKDGKNGYRKLLEPTRPYQLWASDWKEIKVFGFVVYVFIILDVYTRQLMGHYCSLIKDTSSALHAGRMAVEKVQEDELFDPRMLIMHRDNGSAYIYSGRTRSFGETWGSSCHILILANLPRIRTVRGSFLYIRGFGLTNLSMIQQERYRYCFQSSLTSTMTGGSIVVLDI